MTEVGRRFWKPWLGVCDSHKMDEYDELARIYVTGIYISQLALQLETETG